MTFKVFLHRKAAKFLEDMNPRVRERVKEGLGSLEDFPAVKLDLVKVSGEGDVYRVSGFRLAHSETDVYTVRFGTLPVEEQAEWRGEVFSLCLSVFGAT